MNSELTQLAQLVPLTFFFCAAEGSEPQPELFSLSTYLAHHIPSN